MRYWIVS